MRRFFVVAVCALVCGCGSHRAKPSGTLVDARKNFQTKLVAGASSRQPVPPPPPIFSLEKYKSAVGELPAYVTPDPQDGKKHPAIVWITGGDCNSIDDGCWTEGPASNDQSAAAFRKAGIVMMFPSLRGGNNNPGKKESFLGEVDDVIAAADYLGKQKYVDPSRIYLGGHSTGGTMAMLVSECSDKFRAVFAFGAVDEVDGYGAEFLTCERTSQELNLRSPGDWLADIKRPTFVFEGTSEGNLHDLQAMQTANTNDNVHFYTVRGATHFSILKPTTRLIADRILTDDGPQCKLSFTEEELGRQMGK